MKITPEKLSQIERVFHSRLGTDEWDEEQDQTAKIVIKSDLMNVIKGALDSLAENKIGNGVCATSADDIVSAFVYCTTLGIRVGIALSEAEQLENSLKG